MSFGSKSSKTKQQNEDVEILLKRIDEQNEQIGRLQSKFRDVTAAYKSLLNEKKALEIIVKSVDTKSSANTSQSNKKPAPDNPISRSVSNSDVSEIDYQQNDPKDEKIQSLMTNIQLLIESKSKLEQSYQAEKKKLKSDYEELKNKFDAFKFDQEKLNEEKEFKLKETKQNLKQSLTDRDKLTQELNSLIKIKQDQNQNNLLTASNQNEEVILNLRIENNDLKLKIKNLNKQFENKCEELVQNEIELNKFKLAHTEQIKYDENELLDLRKQLKEMNQVHERIVVDLENRIAELCETIRNYEITKSDKKEEILPVHNTSKVDFDSLIEQFISLKSHIETTSKELNLNFKITDLFPSNLTTNPQKIVELETELDKLKQDNKHLKEEYEKYKIRTNYLIKSSKQLNQQESKPENNQVQKLKDEIDVLKKRIQIQEAEAEEELQELKKNYEKQIENLKLEYKKNLEQFESERVKTISELEKEMLKQRERTMNLLKEKENELINYKKETNGLILNSDKEGFSDSDSDQNRLIYFTETNALKDTELNRLRLAKIDLEYKLKQTYDEHSVDIDRLQNQIQILKEEIERLKLNESRSQLNGENLEYIKNVIFNYMTTKDLNVKISMITAIMQILKFNKTEKQKLNQILKLNVL